MITRYVTLAANTEKTVTFAPGYDEVAVYHDGTVAHPVYVDTGGFAAVVPSDTGGTVDYTVTMVTPGARRIIEPQRANREEKRKTVSLKSPGAARVGIEFS